MAWSIRQAAFDDAPGIGRVQLESWRVAYGELLPDEYLDGMSDVRHAAMWSEVLSQSDRVGATFVATDDNGAVVGFADCAPSEAPEEDEDQESQPGGDGDETEEAAAAGARLAKSGEIGSIFVLPDWQGQGIGKSFVANTARHLASHELESLVVWVLHDDPGRTFYEKLGGDACALREIQFIDSPLVQVCYQWVDISQLVLIDLMG